MRLNVVGLDPGIRKHPTGLVVVMVDDHVEAASEADPHDRGSIMGATMDDIRASRAGVADEVIRTRIRTRARVVGGWRGAPPPKPPRTFSITWIERRPAYHPDGEGDPYEALATYVHRFLALPQLVIDEIPPWLAVDDGGMGNSISERLRVLGVSRMFAISATGSGAGLVKQGRGWTIGASTLTHNLEQAIAGHRVTVANVPERDSLAAELAAIKAVVLPSGRERFESSGEDEEGRPHHGDLASATALAITVGMRVAMRRPLSSDDFPKLQR